MSANETETRAIVEEPKEIHKTLPYAAQYQCPLDGDWEIESRFKFMDPAEDKAWFTHREYGYATRVLKNGIVLGSFGTPKNKG